MCMLLYTIVSHALFASDWERGHSSSNEEFLSVYNDIKDTLGPTNSVLIFQVSLHAKGYFGTITSYPSVLIFKCPD